MGTIDQTHVGAMRKIYEPILKKIKNWKFGYAWENLIIGSTNCIFLSEFKGATRKRRIDL